MINFFSSNYLARKPIEKAMQNFAKRFKQEDKVLDIGCGKKPYARYFSCEYVGLDPFKEVNPDIVANAWEIPKPDNYFDGVVMNQSLEHIAKTELTIAEIKRILKPGGLCIVTAPQTMKNHGIPFSSKKTELNKFDNLKIKFFNVDYYRFTKFGLIYLFNDFEIMELKETSGYFGTIFQLINYFLATLKPVELLFFPLYFLFNTAGMLIDGFFRLIGHLEIGIFEKFNELIYFSLTLNYILIAKNNKKVK